MNRNGILAGLLTASALLLSPIAAQAQLRVVTYNVATDTNPAGDTARAGMDTVLQGIGLDSVNGIERPLDILSLQETKSGLAGAQSIVDILNTLYGAGTYARSTLAGPSTDGTTEAVIYNTKTVQLISQVAVGSASTVGAARAPLRFQFRPVGYDSSADFYIYDDHYKSGTNAASGSTPSDAARRAVEAATVRADADSLGAGARILFTGDYNVENSSEVMYTTLTAPATTASPGQAIDPLGRPGNWHSNSAFEDIHTQAALVNTPTGSDLTGGGVDDRFDFQLSTAPMLSGQGVSYIGVGVPNLSGTVAHNSYHTFGNNGTTFNTDVNAPSNTALPAAEYNPGVGQPTRTDVLNALTTASDHLPVVADYQLPAKMSVTLNPVPAQVIIGGNASVTLNVSNVAPVAVALGADQLTYSGGGSGAVSGTLSGNLKVFDTPALHSLALDTSTTGAKSGVVAVTSSSVSVSNGSFSQAVNYTVLDHSAGEFQNPSSSHTLNIDFGTVAAGSSVARTFRLTNLFAANRAGLDFDSFTESGDLANRFSTDLTPFADLPDGAVSNSFDVSLATDTPGTYSASYTLNLGDDSSLIGATGGQTLTLNVSGMVVSAVPEPTSFVLLGIGALIVWARRRKIAS